MGDKFSNIHNSKITNRSTIHGNSPEGGKKEKETMSYDTPTFQNLIKENKLGECIESLNLTVSHSLDEQAQNSLVLLSNQYSSFLEKKLNRLISQESIQLEERQLSHALLMFINTHLP